jgi:hypothetical protein
MNGYPGDGGKATDPKSMERTFIGKVGAKVRKPDGHRQSQNREAKTNLMKHSWLLRNHGRIIFHASIAPRKLITAESPLPCVHARSDSHQGFAQGESVRDMQAKSLEAK